MILTTLRYRMKLNSFIHAGEQLVAELELDPYHRVHLSQLLLQLDAHAAALYPAEPETEQ